MSKSRHLEIYFPSRKQDGDEVAYSTYSSAYQDLVEFLMTHFGGFTKIYAKGYYKSPSGNTMFEDIQILSIYSSWNELEEAWNSLVVLMGELKLIMSQESWAYTLDNIMYFI